MSIDKSVISRFTTLFLEPEVMRRIGYYTQAADGEVSGLGTIKKDDKGRHVVSNVYLLEQEASAADTELKPEAISTLMTDMMKANQDPATLKFWWHSHATMQVFWSGTDDACAETLSREFAFSLVVNKAGDKKCRLDLYNPFRITFDGVKVEILPEEDIRLKEACEAEVREKVKSASERWSNWRDKEYTDAYYGQFGGHYNGKTRTFGSTTYLRKDKTRITLPDAVVDDAKKLVETAARNSDIAGIFAIETWNEYILDIMKEVTEKRFEKKAGCHSFGTFDKDYPHCGHGCKVVKDCQFWSKYFLESEKDAAKQEYPDEVVDASVTMEEES